ncbi:MAG: 4Fe-4S binding protein [Chromatiales bacterium]|jgi:polyferredoxin|nr:4Fe-4S binding protein [Chromatiales bacterium]
MHYSKALSQIPIVSADAKAGRKLHSRRRAVQIGTVLLAILIPVSGLFRIDPVDGAFVVLDRQIWFSDFYIVIGLWLALSSLLVMTYSLVGTAFCGWSCPQNTLAEWANHMTHRLLGKRAEVSLDGKPIKVSSGKNKWINWTILGSVFLLAAMVTAFVPMFYFYSPEQLWHFVTFQHDERLAGSLHWIYTIFVLILFVNIAFVRHFWCRFMCVYRVWQHSFKTRETLRIAYDNSHQDECARCNFCETSCFIGIDPRQTVVYDACINCGECITACSTVRGARKTGNSLLRFGFGEQSGAQTSRRGNVGSVMLRAPWAAMLTAFGVALFTWGLWSYDAYRHTVYRAETAHAAEWDYRINIASKLYQPVDISVSVEGLPEGSYQLEADHAEFLSAGRKDIHLRINAGLAPGLHPFLVYLNAPDGERRSFRVHHLVEGGA